MYIRAEPFPPPPAPIGYVHLTGRFVRWCQCEKGAGFVTKPITVNRWDEPMCPSSGDHATRRVGLALRSPPHRGNLNTFIDEPLQGMALRRTQ